MRVDFSNGVFSKYVPRLICLFLFQKLIKASESQTIEATLQPMFAGCGQSNLSDSYRYGLINQGMHVGMAINFTGNPEYDFLAGMIPHHRGAVDMCAVYLNSTQYASESANPGIESLCYNITYGALKWGNWQDDFSQTGEAEQMTKVIEELGKTVDFENRCTNLTACEEYLLVEESEHSMFMGCGQVHLDMPKQYMNLNMEMHQLMALNFTGDADIDFLLGMIPHHQAAVEMCDIYYEHWSCAPTRTVCNEPLPFEEIQNKLSRGEEVSILNQMHHICTAHILETQPSEIDWMLAELGRLDPDALYTYQSRTDEYPCGSAQHAHVWDDEEVVHPEPCHLDGNYPFYYTHAAALNASTRHPADVHQHDGLWMPNMAFSGDEIHDGTYAGDAPSCVASAGSHHHEDAGEDMHATPCQEKDIAGEDTDEIETEHEHGHDHDHDHDHGNDEGEHADHELSPTTSSVSPTSSPTVVEEFSVDSGGAMEHGCHIAVVLLGSFFFG
ncbi:hypothetical protein CYMTET_12360 [Cymbomonas tetramitiformis]|uniref:DUF305 domain-containing protein n=1 Tax=Cymbomonas tetramitiformis TaxID=36881 RepID=A0AAE0LCJ2_9CHLO|nr:hypothetical protein CYMTET_12360 [Cymbomonas tetramitiformis]